MAKRDVAAGASAKRGKDAAHETHASLKEEEEDGDIEMGDAETGSEHGEEEAGDDDEDDDGGNDEVVVMSAEEVAEKGLQVWHAVKDAVNKDGRQLSLDFARLPSKRQYSDYYRLIIQPISLEEIKQKLDKKKYGSLNDARADFELMCKNARAYNVRESQIWRDAKSLQKLANKTIDKLLGLGDGEEGEGKKREKKPDVNRLMKNRLNKLISLTDEYGASRSDIFMILPSKKEWPEYYTIIKKPKCFEEIFKHIKRKEYPSLQDFISDVDLVFDNAMTFNADGSPIYENASYLKNYFHNLMSDLPKHFASIVSPTDQQPPTLGLNKIKLKLPGLHHAAASSGGGGEGASGSGSAGTVRLRVPVLNGGGATSKEAPAPTPATTIYTLPPAASIGRSGGVAADSLKSPKTAHHHHHPKPPAVASATTHAAKSTATASSSTAKVKSPPVPLANNTANNTNASSSTMGRTIHNPPAASYAQAKHAAPTFSVQQQHQYSPHPQASYPQYAGGSYGAQPNYQQTPKASTRPLPLGPQRLSATPVPTSAAPVYPSLPGPSTSQPPVPRVQADPGMSFVRLVTQPLGRTLELDIAEGVRTWSVRLGTGEDKVLVTDVRFRASETERDGLEGGSSEIEEGATGDEMDVDAGEGAGLEDPAPPPKPAKKRGRGRPRKTAVAVKEEAGKAKLNGKPPSSVSSPGSARKRRKVVSPAAFIEASVDEVLVKLGAVQISPNAKESDGTEKEKEGEWEVELGQGRHVLEVGKKGNTATWKVFLERRAG